MKLYDFGFIILLLAGLGIYGANAYDRAKADEITVKERVKKDYHNTEEFFAAGDSANHDRYNK